MVCASANLVIGVQPGACAYVALQALECSGSALGIHVILQQREFAVEDQLAYVLIGQQVFVVEIDAFDAQVCCLDHDLQILAYVGILLRRKHVLKLGLGLGKRGASCARPSSA